MKIARKISGIIIITIFLSAHVYGAGETGAQFLKIGVGARACALSESFAGVADDPSAIYWNPAGITQLSRIELLGMHNFWLLDMSYQYLAVVVPTRLGSFGAALAYSSSGNIPKYENFQKLGEYTAYDVAGTIAYAKKLGFLSLGLGFKIIQQKIEEESATGFAGDIGVLYEFNNFKIGIAVQNIGPGIKFIEVSDPLPLNYTAGSAFKWGSLLLTADIKKSRDDDFRLNGGAEFLIMNTLALRAGSNTANSFTAGAGVTYQKISVDYGLVPYKDIDTSHRISIRIRF